MERGTIKWFSPIKGYGFVTTADGADIFLHSTGLAEEQDRHLFPGDSVTFNVADGDRGPKAVELRKDVAPVAQNQGE